MTHAKINCLICDDEPLAQDILESYIQRVPYLNLVGKAGDAMSCIQLVQDNAVDLVFLDIEMPDMTGVELLRTQRDFPRVIFTTAYPNHAVEGFALNAVDYLLKPIPFDRFMQAVSKVYEQLNARSPQPVAGAGHGEPEFIFVKSDTQLLKVYLNDILFIEGLGDYVKIHTKGKIIVTLQTLKHLSGKLPGELFVRVHRSFIVALSKIDSINGQTIFIGTNQIPIGNLYKDVFFEIVNQRNL